jgi:hypothetical protein
MVSVDFFSVYSSTSYRDLRGVCDGTMMSKV